VRVERAAARSAGVPSKTIRPPSWPAPGPRSMVWGQGNVHVLGDRGTVRMELEDVKRFDSGVVLLSYLPAS
jgi:hypothetical protein